jgi:hypothetical protein
MSPVDQLMEIAQISLTLAGFAGIIATFQFQKSNSITQGHVLALSLIVNISLVGTFFSLLPIVFLNYGFNEQHVWRMCSALMAINISAFIIYIWRRSHTKTVSKTIKTFYGFSFLAAGILVVTNIMNGIGYLSDRQFAAYFVNFIFCLFLVGFYFSRLLLLPLWKYVKRTEASGAGSVPDDTMNS